jgi:hypothetical protein
VLAHEIADSIERRLRDQAARRAIGDPERIWLARARSERASIRVDLGGPRRALRAIVVAILGLF